MDKLLKVIVALNAVDKMSGVFRKATSDSLSSIDKLKKASEGAFGKGSKMLGAGVAVAASLAPAITAYADLEDANSQLKASMMDANGNVGADFEKMTRLAEELGDKLPGTTADFDLLFETLKNNGVGTQTILNGVGKSAAYLGVALKMPYDEAGKFAAKMKEATGVADSEMMGFLDTIARVRNVGVDVNEMQYAFGRSAGALKLMGLQGLEASRGVAAVYAQLIRAGMSGETVGTGFATIMNSMLDPKKYNAMKGAAAKLGVDLKMFDKDKFLGIENMVKQLDKLKSLSAGQRAGIVNALTGGGQDSAMLQTLIDNGLSGLQKMNAELKNQADLYTKVAAMLQTLHSIWEATAGTISNMAAALGAGIAPELKRVGDLFGNAASGIKTFLSNNPSFAKFIGLTITATGVLLSVIGVINLMKSAFIALRVVMATNPFILAAMVAIMVIAAIYSNWGKISGWFKNLWAKTKQIFFAALDGLKYIIGNFTPVGLIFTHWSKIVAFFTGIFERVKGVFFNLVGFVLGLGSRFFNAGINIVSSIWKGIKSMANKPIEAIRDMTKKMRDFLPFSPAKEGAFRDLHRVKIVETIAQAIKPAPALKAIARVTSEAGARFGIQGGSIPKPNYANATIGGNTITVNFTPNISGGNNRSILEELRREIPQLARMLNRELEKQNRGNYG